MKLRRPACGSPAVGNPICLTGYSTSSISPLDLSTDQQFQRDYTADQQPRNLPIIIRNGRHTCIHLLGDLLASKSENHWATKMGNSLRNNTNRYSSAKRRRKVVEWNDVETLKQNTV